MNLKTKKLTVAIPTFNREAYLREALISLARQTNQNFAVIIFDNASPYDIRALLAEFPQLATTLIRHTHNIGAQANLAYALSYQYDTPYVMLFHDDDAIHPRYFADALPILDGHNDTQWIASTIRYVRTPSEMEVFATPPATLPLQHCSKQEVADAFMGNIPIGFSTVIYRQEVLSQIRPDSDRFHIWSDRPFMLEAMGDKKATILHFPYINYRIHLSQDSAQQYVEHIPEMIRVIAHISAAGSTEKARVFTTTSTLRTATINATSVQRFFAIMKQFKKQGLYRTRDIRPHSLYWVVRLLLSRLYRRFVRR